MPFKPRNQCARRPDRLSDEEIRLRKMERSRQWRKTHPYDPEKRMASYYRTKNRECFPCLSVPKNNTEGPIQRNHLHAPSKQKFAWDECPENLLNEGD
jgi:hypothetical protein